MRDASTMDRPVEAAPRLRRRWLIAAAAAALVFIGATTLPGILRWASSERAVDATALRFGTVTRGDLVREVAVDGSVVAAFRPTLTSPARGVARVEVQAGQTVARDQVLVRVESPEVNSRWRRSARRSSRRRATCSGSASWRARTSCSASSPSPFSACSSRPPSAPWIAPSAPSRWAS